MTDTAITLLIREVLAEELGRIKQARKPQPGNAGAREELVQIASDNDLRAFAARVLKLADDPKARRDFDAGRLVFRLARAGPHQAEGAATDNTTARIDKGFLSERQVDALPRATKRLLLGRAVCLTPLARDRLRQRGIAIERTGS